MLSGLSLANLPTAANLSNMAAQQVQPNAVASPSQDSSTAQSTNNENPNTQQPNASSQEAPAATKADTQTKATDQLKTGDDNKRFKDVMEKTDTSSATAVDTNTQNSDKDLDAEDVDMSAAVAAVMATITETLANVASDIELDIDFSELSVAELDTYSDAMSLIDDEVQVMMGQTIDEISSVDMTDLNALMQKSEMLDDLQSLHEELLENIDEIGYQQDLRAQELVKTEVQAELVVDDSESTINLDGFTQVEQVEYKAVNADIKPERREEQDTDDNPELKLDAEISLEVVNPNKQQNYQEQAVEVKQELEAVKATTQEVTADSNVQEISADNRAAVEVKSQEKSKGESFLDKIQFLTVKEDRSALKGQVDAKADIDTRTRQVLIQAADELKSAISDRAEAKTLEIKKDDIQVNVEIATVDLTDNSQANPFGKIVAETFKELNIAKPEAPSFTPKQVINLVHDKVLAAPVNTQEVLKFQLNPRELGNITITITKEAKGVSIQMMVDNDAAIGTLKQDVSSLSSALKDKGLELKDIDISKTSSEGTSSQQQSRGEFNEAREEQKKRMSETQPYWLDEANQPSFEKQLKGMLNIWRSKV